MIIFLDTQLQQIVDKTIIYADTDGDGKISYEEFCAVSPSFLFHFPHFYDTQIADDVVDKLVLVKI